MIDRLIAPTTWRVDKKQLRARSGNELSRWCVSEGRVRAMGVEEMDFSVLFAVSIITCGHVLAGTDGRE